ncbi:peptidylprolyl isomerase [Synechococcus elongatus]|uniref:peptidylprolyl isomerase n=1 Tax=Synechococcus elongatus PCC 11801 TaxID=2219813 RepID=A0AAN1QQ72_SYNEL|nr:peptidylprolyl isomerase [Synechococcus elongatus]AZB73513.1 peptidylprolyl isomerase [Synechococcus elongatus PCC 11801]
MRSLFRIATQGFLIALVAWGLTACSSTSTSLSAANANPSDVARLYPDIPRLEGSATVVLTVNNQPIEIDVLGADAPLTAGNFVDLVSKGVYDGTSFHRVVKEPQPFVVQGGDPQSKDPKVPAQQLGTGSYQDPNTKQLRYLPLEITPEGASQPVYSRPLEQAGVSQPPKLRHQRGAVAMARSSFPDSASSQFYIALSDLGFLDGNYAVFGYVRSDMSVVDRIKQGDRIQSAKVTAGLDNLKRP